MRADLYTIALISALPEDHPLLANTHASTFNVDDNTYGIHPVSTEGLEPYDRSPNNEDGEQETPTDEEQITAICSALTAGVDMLVVQRDLINPVRNLINPPPPPEPYYMTRLTSNTFMGLFTKAERDVIYAAAQNNIDLQQWKDKAIGADYVDTKDDETIDGLVGLVAAGLLTQERSEEILKGVLVE